MKKAIIISTIIAATLSHSTSAFAAKKSSTEQDVGVASGALVGAAAGGPIGFLIGAAIGGLLGDEVNTANQVDGMKTQLSDAHTQQQALQAEIDTLKHQAYLTAQQSPTLNGSESLQMDLMFRTASSTLNTEATQRIDQLAGFLQQYPTLTINLDGYADPRGDEAYNQALSESRVNEVRQRLMEQGIAAHRIITTAYGESTSSVSKGDVDGYAQERRVSIRFSADTDTSVAQN
ncbi:sortase-associated OmpA-like protein PdsO [Pleionea sp. CnH1-48]|uniref:sortase-associated OmpA-like protein PdsO n=1 Tax=Pleionea sp. CnH1-48 TaxID=2954494 RepID=UPI0020968C34|nr:sortase-associated OmpA-like protein PdsO [Pleionea sp. CnH1-48]MCO7227029.1 sortase-associated OmpA-like protein PdsO [Pleionea sp. CnH1-48]